MSVVELMATALCALEAVSYVQWAVALGIRKAFCGMMKVVEVKAVGN
jgi:hypothetical protein